MIALCVRLRYSFPVIVVIAPCRPMVCARLIMFLLKWINARPQHRHLIARRS
ncbi:hypothetical protein BJV82DRAFT_614696, partial [Fennellomyces sp. T-0311]